MESSYTKSIIICQNATQPDFLHYEVEVFEFRMFNLVSSLKFYVRRLERKNLFRIKLMFMWTILLKFLTHIRQG